MRALNRLIQTFVFTGTLLLCGSSVEAQDIPASWKLDDAIRIALEQSPKIHQAQARAERAQGQAERTLAVFRRPTLTLTGSYTRLSSSNAQSSGGAGSGSVQNPYSVGLNGTAPGTQTVQLSNSASTTRARQTGSTSTEEVPSAGFDVSQFGFTTALNQRSVGISLAQRLDFTGLGRAYRSVSQADFSLARQEQQQTQQELIYNVTTAFYSALRSEALIRVSEASVRQSEEQVRISQIKFEQGTYARNDVLRARSQLANNRQSLISARHQAMIARDALANTMGIDPTTPIQLTADETSSLPELPALSQEKMVEEALIHRPEAVSARLNEIKARGNLRIARQGQEPTFTASLTGSYNGAEGIALSRRSTGTAGVSLSFPLSDGGATAANVQIARADIRLAAAQSVEYRNGIRAEVEQASIALRDAQERVNSALPALEEAREGYRLSEARVNAGSATQLTLYDAQSALVQAEVNAINARYDYLSALARLTRAMGSTVLPRS